MRNGVCTRETLETKISVAWELDGSGSADIRTGIGYFDHMLTLLAKHSFTDLKLKATGDLEVDGHHIVEDCGLTLGRALKDALGDKAGIHRYGTCFMPMDETLAQIVIDFSGRPLLVFEGDVPKVQLGMYDAELTEEFFRALAAEAGLTLHIRIIYGKNTHHIIETIFKGFARALSEAVAIDGRVKGIMSSKGVL
ncbi:MAG: imidazoleglycerol-phosphate dehydratase HisB [Phascolarctobacterium sp.]|nr:imidazoleglycerol-phosphate dehydratase HisB [Phascolarctobacterium sp.]